MQVTMKDFSRVSMITARMGPVTERDNADEPGSFALPPPKMQNAVLQQKLNENDLDKLAEKNVQRRDS